MGWITELWNFRSNPFSIRELSSPEELNQLFVDRNLEVRQLRNALMGSEGGIVYGISGLRGVGKSTVLNKVLEEVMKAEKNLVVKVKASGYYEELDFMKKILTDMCDQIEVKEMPRNVKEEIVRLKTNLLYTEKVEEGKASEGVIRSSIKASIFSIFGTEVGTEVSEKIREGVERQLKPYSKSTLTREILNFLQFLKREASYSKIVVGIDETDKCRFTIAEKLLDSIKTILVAPYCHFVFVGTLEFHKNFIKAFRPGEEEEATMASVFESVLPIRPLNENQILEIIEKRLSYFSLGKKVRNPFSNKALKVITSLARGIPKIASRLCSESFIYFGENGKRIGPEELVEYLEEKGYIPELTPLEKKYMKRIKRIKVVKPLSKTFVDGLSKLGVTHKRKTQYYKYLDRLVDKRYLLKTTDKSGNVIYEPTELSQYVSI